MKLTYKCKECGADILTPTGLSTHLLNAHGIQDKDYYDKHIKNEDEGKCIYCGKDTTFLSIREGYRKFCSNGCAKKWSAEHDDGPCEIKCEICGYPIKGKSKNSLQHKFAIHLKSHNVEKKDYYDKYMKKPGEGICPICHKPTNFNTLWVGYNKYCGPLCAANSVKTRELAEEYAHREEIRLDQESKEERVNNYIQELKDRVHQFDWEGERNTWAGGTRTRRSNDKNNLLTDNSMTYIDGQNYSAEVQTITDNDEQSFNDVFWL